MSIFFKILFNGKNTYKSLFLKKSINKILFFRNKFVNIAVEIIDNQ